ncbi:MAG: hypothetical protein LBV79_03220 [Candidatus Adiutrix sp.]|jgi:hypothetical protein|nr:hypothetical protein [Candidatus Adiutrix sp.]
MTTEAPPALWPAGWTWRGTPLKASATVELTGEEASVGNLTVTAGFYYYEPDPFGDPAYDFYLIGSGGTANFITNNARLLNTQQLAINGAQDTAGNAKITALNAAINTNGHDVAISTADAIGGTKGIYAASLATGNGMVTMTGAGSGDSLAQLALADSLQTRQLNLTGNGAAASLNTNIGRVDVTGFDTEFNFTNTVASADSGASGVYFKAIDLGALSAVRTLNAVGAGLGTYWADTLRVHPTGTPGAGQKWIGNLWLGGSPASGTVGTMDMVLPAGTNLVDYLGDGSSNPNYMMDMISTGAGQGVLTLEDGLGINLVSTGGNPFKDLKPGDLIQLVKTYNTYNAEPIVDNTTGTVPVYGVSAMGARDYTFRKRISDDRYELLAELLSSALNGPVGQTYLEGPTAALGSLNLSTELESRVIRNTFDPNASKSMFQDGRNLGVMFGAEYTNLRLNSGSEVESDNFNVVIGPAFRSETAIGQLGLGLFFEAGYGDYSTYNSYHSFSGLEEVVGEGDNKYFGGGLGLRNNFARGLYADLSVRAGSVENDLKIKNRNGAEYGMNSSYFGGHLGFGKLFDFEDHGRLDINTRLLWVQLGSDEVRTAAEETLSIDAAQSLRTQLGARYSRDFSDLVAGYVGGAWEYEHDGGVSGRLDGLRLPEPSLKGAPGSGELGLTLTPTAKFSINLGLQGYTGQRKGAGGTAMMNFAF